MTPPRPAFPVLSLALALLAACAGRTRPEDPPGRGAPPGPPLPRSSIAAVVMKGELLGLDATQVDALQRLDAELQVRVERLRADLAPAPGRGARPSVAPEGAGESRGGPGGMGGGAGAGPPGGGGMGAPPGGMGGPPPGGGGAVRSGPDAEAMATLAARLDDEDTRAFLRAETLLRPEQREAAREIASDYRALRYERRQARRR